MELTEPKAAANDGHEEQHCLLSPLRLRLTVSPLLWIQTKKVLEKIRDAPVEFPRDDDESSANEERSKIN